MLFGLSWPECRTHMLHSVVIHFRSCLCMVVTFPHVSSTFASSLVSELSLGWASSRCSDSQHGRADTFDSFCIHDSSPFLYHVSTVVVLDPWCLFSICSSADSMLSGLYLYSKVATSGIFPEKATIVVPSMPLGRVDTPPPKEPTPRCM